MIQCHLMSEREKEIISEWKYDGDYAIYNLPPYWEQKERGIVFGNQERGGHFLAYYEEDVLIGFTNFLEREKEVFIGIGVNPNLCGRGYGSQILLQAVDILRKRYPGKAPSLEVRTWNQRAIRCYEKAGFRIDGIAFEKTTAIGKGMFFRMVKSGLG